MSEAVTGSLREDVVARLRRSGCVFAEEEADLLLAATPDGAAREELVRRRVAGEPLEHLLGWAEFGDLRVAVRPGVFVPRRRTLLLARLAETALARAERTVHTRPVTVLEMCCGVGAITARLTARSAASPRAAASPPRLIAADIDPDAVACARLNAPDALVVEGDLFAALPADLAGTIDVVVANAPYVPTAAIGSMPPEARDHEHRVALDGGDDGLDVHRRIAAEVGPWLAPGGTVIVETSVRQAPTSAALFRAAGLHTRVVRDERVEGTAVVGRTRHRSTDGAAREHAAGPTTDSARREAGRPHDGAATGAA
ncbi:putative protein N(5)-glutamine methyltransferase [Tersicoccus sp. MR15.9]|uniref:putative protein N(5)-glutamine methyltransferase n=1 Tax=Tersicoccus mangrovi TaxID=3121635 RepID=UPI002FE5267C